MRQPRDAEKRGHGDAGKRPKKVRQVSGFYTRFRDIKSGSKLKQEKETYSADRLYFEGSLRIS